MQGRWAKKVPSFLRLTAVLTPCRHSAKKRTKKRILQEQREVNAWLQFSLHLKTEWYAPRTRLSYVCKLFFNPTQPNPIPPQPNPTQPCWHIHTAVLLCAGAAGSVVTDVHFFIHQSFWEIPSGRARHAWRFGHARVERSPSFLGANRQLENRFARNEYTAATTATAVLVRRNTRYRQCSINICPSSD